MKRVFTTLLLLFDLTPSVCNHRLNSCCVTRVWTSHMSNQMFMILTLMFSFIIYLQYKSVTEHYLLKKQLYNIMLPTSVLYLVAIYTAWSQWRVSGFMYVVVQSCTVSPRLQNNKVSEFPKQTNNKSEPVGCQHVYHVVYTIFLYLMCSLFFLLFMSQARQFFLLSPSAAKNSQLYANNEPWPPLGCWCWLSTRVPHFFVPFVLSGLLNFSPVTGICYICPQRLFLAVWFKPELLHRGNTARPRVWWLWTPDHNIHISEHTEKLDISWPLPVRLYSV